MKKSAVVERSPEPARFLELDLVANDLTPHKLQHMVCGSSKQNYQVIVADPPWMSTCLPTDHHDTTYELISSDKLLGLFNAVDRLFVPSESMPLGEMFMWFTMDKFELALECMQVAGYNLVSIHSWHKTCRDGTPMKMSPHRSNVELFLVGRKLWNADADFRTTRGFSAPPFLQMHSSKPVEFYTEYLPIRAPHYGREWAKVKKLDLFTRHSQHGVLSMGNEYFGPRIQPEKPTIVRNPATTIKRIRSEYQPISEEYNKMMKKRQTARRPKFQVGDIVRVLGQNSSWEAKVLRTTDKVYVEWVKPQRGAAPKDWVEFDNITV